MDKIIELIVIFYLISAILRFLMKGRKNKKERPYSPPQRSAPSPSRPAPPPVSDRGAIPFPIKRTGQLYPKERDALDVLAEWERRARPGPPLPKKASGGEVQKRPKSVVKVSKISRAVEAKLKEQERLNLAPSIEPVIQREKDEEQLIFSHPDMLRQGIIMSEILRPPLARRKPFLWPYLRG